MSKALKLPAIFVALLLMVLHIPRLMAQSVPGTGLDAEIELECHENGKPSTNCSLSCQVGGVAIDVGQTGRASQIRILKRSSSGTNDSRWWMILNFQTTTPHPSGSQVQRMYSFGPDVQCYFDMLNQTGSRLMEWRATKFLR